MRHPRLLQVGVLVLSCGCQALMPLPPGGIARAQAETIAAVQAPGHVDVVLSARVLPLGEAVGPNTDPGPPRDRLVWAFVFEGTFPPGSCGGVPPPGVVRQCPPPALTALVVIDYETGDFIMAATPADAR